MAALPSRRVYPGGRLLLIVALLATAGLIVFCTVALGQEAADPKPPVNQPAEPAAKGVEVSTTRPGAFDIHYRGADLRGVLQLLSTQGKRNIIATKEVTGTVTADLYNVTFTEALDAILRANGFVYEERGNFIFVYTPEQLKKHQEATRPMTTKMIRLAYIPAADAKAMLTPVLSDKGSISVSNAAVVGIEPSATTTGGDSYAINDMLIVKDYEDVVKEIVEMVRQLDVQPRQILFEVTILSATLTEDTDLGVDMSILHNVDYDALGATLSTDGTMTLTTANDITTPLPGPGNVGVGRTQFGRVPNGMSFGLLYNHVAFFVSALEAVTDTTVLANPKMLVVNKQKGEILIGERQGYKTTTQTDTTFTENIEFMETGTKLILRPFIGRDGMIRVEVHPEESEGSVDAAGLPFETTTEVTSNVMVRDGHTIVIGGLFREQTSNGRKQVPLLGNLPIVGTIFRKTEDGIGRKEIIVLLTPHIVHQPNFEATSERIKDDAERFRIGQRKGLQWFGRERLATYNVRLAKRALSKGKPKMALWQLNLALGMRPRMEEAIQMREQLTGQAYWADEVRHSSIHYVLQEAIMHDLKIPYKRMIPPNKPRSAADVPGKVRKAFGIGQRLEDPLEGQESAGPAETPKTPPDKSSAGSQ